MLSLYEECTFTYLQQNRRPMISLSMRSSSAFRESSHIMRQIPDVLVGFDSSKGGHPAQTNSIFYNAEQFAIGVLLYLGRCEIRGARIHPAPASVGLWPSRP